MRDVGSYVTAGSKSRKRSGLLLLLVTAVAGCSSIEPVQPEPMTFSGLAEPVASSSPTAVAAGQAVTDRWWQSFDDQMLNRLIEDSLANNFTLQSAWARLQQSQALARQAGAEQFPTLDASLSRSRSFGPDAGTNRWQAGLSAAYEVDFWGRVSALEQQGQLDALASAASVRVAANTLAGEVAQAWFGWLRQQGRIQLLSQQQQRVRSALAITEVRFNRGQVAISDVWQQQQLLENLSASLSADQAQQIIYQQQLAVWLGRSDWLQSELVPELAAMPPRPLPRLPSSSPRVSLSALQQRPDVQQSWFALQSANAALAAAIANRYPRLTLSASYSASDANLADIFDNWVGNLAAGLVAPLLDGGRRRAAVTASEAGVQATVADYQQTLLAAAQTVQQLLVQEQQASDQLASLVKQLHLARKTEAFQLARYRRGVGDFLALLNVQQDVLALEQTVLDGQWQQLQYRIQLYRSVSHGDFTGADAGESQP
ncbi:TolC family protein [Oceanobacter sp. 5_MG-2023]|uniref:TolC family protein n=2 Tax=Gammaproteobacteria TaxID=1236 RepID=UPI0026E2A2EF|nr:TolC family protein [Oceanobacter sp. 5_MG-2023]MDO6681226.1 TolC family protein [Oceanobacter sp. 5_MG-2023]